jgi:hypothetical protein
MSTMRDAASEPSLTFTLLLNTEREPAALRRRLRDRQLPSLTIWDKSTG